MRDAASATAHSTATVVECWVMCRNLCSAVIESRPKYVGTEQKPVQIEKSYFAGRRKYRRGRILSGDGRGSNRPDTDNEYLSNWNSSCLQNTDEENSEELTSNCGLDCTLW